jgi:hypothetical protein
MGFPGNYKSKIDFRKKMSSYGPYSAQGLATTTWPKGQNAPASPTGSVARVRPQGGHRSPGPSGGAASGGQPANEEVHRRWLRHRGASRSLSGKEKRTMGLPCNVSMKRWLGWRCVIVAAVSRGGRRRPWSCSAAQGGWEVV